MKTILKFRTKNNLIFKLLTVCVLIAFSCNDAYSLGVRPASQNAAIQKKMLTAAYRQVRTQYAKDDDEKKVLKYFGATALLFPNGKKTS